MAGSIAARRFIQRLSAAGHPVSLRPTTFTLAGPPVAAHHDQRLARHTPVTLAQRDSALLGHGNQIGRFFHGYDDHYCFLPLYVFCGDQLLAAYLRPANRDGARHAGPILKLLVERPGQAWPGVRFILRADRGVCRRWLPHWNCTTYEPVTTGRISIDNSVSSIENRLLEGRLQICVPSSRSVCIRNERISTTWSNFMDQQYQPHSEALPPETDRNRNERGKADLDAELMQMREDYQKLRIEWERLRLMYTQLLQEHLIMENTLYKVQNEFNKLKDK